MSSSSSRVMALPAPQSPTGPGCDGYMSLYAMSASSPPDPLSPSAFSSAPFTRDFRQASLTRPPSYGSLASVPLSPPADYSSYLDGLLQWPTSPPAASPPHQPQLMPSQSATAFSSLAMSVPIPPARASLRSNPPPYSAHSHSHSHSHAGHVTALFPSASSSLGSSASSSLSPFAAGSTSAAVANGRVASVDDVRYQSSLLRKRDREYDTTPDSSFHRPPPPQPPASYKAAYNPYDTYDTQPQHKQQLVHIAPPPIAQPAPIQPYQPSASTAASLPPAPHDAPAPPASHNDNPVMYRKSSCMLCHRAKTSCDGRRPCDRCIRLDRQHLCVERAPRSKKGSKNRTTAGKKEKKGTDDDKDDDEDEDGATVKKEHEEDSKEDKDEEMDDQDQASKTDDKSKTDSASTASTSPPPKLINTTTTLSLIQPASASFSAASTAAGSASSFFSSDALVGCDERELSSTFLRVLQSDQVSVQSILKQASIRKSMPPMAFQALISYIANTLHPDDFAAFLKSLDSSSEGNQKAIDALAVDRLHVRLPDGRLMPRVLFTFRKSSLEALPDSERGVDIAMLYVYRVPVLHAKDAVVAERSASGADKTGAGDGDPTLKKQALDGAAAPAYPGVTTSPTTPASPDPNTPAGQQSVKSTDSDSNEPTSPTSISTAASSSAASLASASAAASVSASPSTATSTGGSTPHPASGSPPSSASSTPPSAPAAYPPFVPAPVPGANFGSLSEVDLVIQVNREFERLFGYSQREMKDLMMREQSKGLYRLYTPHSLLQLGRWLTEACTGVKTEFKAIVTIVNKMQANILTFAPAGVAHTTGVTSKGQTSCVLSARFILDPVGFFSSVCYAYMPLPDNIVVK